MVEVKCSWCNSISVNWTSDKFRTYYRCPSCEFTFVLPSYYLSKEEEKGRYDQHINDENEGYVNFLNQMILPMKDLLPETGKGLDFGCGPNPVLAKHLMQYGYAMSVYDPFYAKNLEVLKEKYDFITFTEVIEHMSDPKKEIQHLLSILNPGGLLGIMTDMAPDSEKEFFTWYYKNDATHIGFYRPKTMEYVANYFKLELVYSSDRVVIFKKNQ